MRQPSKSGDQGAPPLSAKTGASGAGAVRFYDLLPGDYTLTPALPDELRSAAVFCRIDGGDPYQKTLENGAPKPSNWRTAAREALREASCSPYEPNSVTLVGRR